MMKRILTGGVATLLMMTSAAFANGYPSGGRAIDKLHPAADYGDLAGGRPLALGIMRARAQGFVPSPTLEAYANHVLAKVLAGVTLPASFRPQVRVLAAPEFQALCTPDGTIVLTVGLLEHLDNEDQLAFILGHEVSHAIYRHHEKDWAKKSQYYAVMNGAAIQQISDAATMAGANGSDVAMGLNLAMHISKLSAHVLGPQMSANQEDEADALGFDLMVKAGYNPDAASQVMDKLAEQEAEAARAAKAAKDAEKASRHGSSGGGGFSLGNIMGAVSGAMSGDWKTLAVFAFDAAVDNMSDEAVSHHPAPERKKMVSDYAFKQYRDTLPVAPTALPWQAPTKKDKDGLAMQAVLTHYGAAEDAAAYIADPTQGTDAKARADVTRSSTLPTTDHAYTQFVAYEYYDKAGQKPQSEAALVRAANGPEASWEVYSRLIDIHMARNDFPGALRLMDQAGVKFEDSPVLLPKHIQIYAAQGDFASARGLLPKCKSYDIDELYDACKKAAQAG